MWIIIAGIIGTLSLGTLCIDQKNQKWIWLLFTVFVALYSLRRSVGTDWVTYKYYFDNLNSEAVLNKYAFENGYYFVNVLFRSFGLSYWSMVFCISLFISVMFYISTKLMTQYGEIALITGLFFYYYPSLEALRQIIAVALFYFSLQYVESKPLKYFLCNVIGVLFHRTALLAIAFYFFYSFRTFFITSFLRKRRDWLKYIINTNTPF